jgi:hypothetical protein
MSYQINPFVSVVRFRGTVSDDIIGYSVGSADADGDDSPGVNQAKNRVL